jgi:outer membrane protein assembly factor BamB
MRVVDRRSLCIAGVVALIVPTALAQRGGGEAEWRQWRGPSNTGVAVGDAPLNWSDTTNVIWKVAIPGRGFSSPVIAGNRIFITTAIPTEEPAQPAAGGGRGPGGGAGAGIEHRFVVMALDRETGKTLWERTATTATPHEGYHRIYGSFASNSPVTDGKRLFTSFGSRGLYAYDVNGRELWRKDFGVQMKMRLQFGEGSAIVLSGNRVLALYDHSGDSFLAALDADTGKEVWRTPRLARSNWSTPLVVEHGGKKQIVVSASEKVAAYEFETGQEIWSATGLGENTIPQPVQNGDMVVVMSGYRNPNLLAIKLGRTGDLTGTDAIVWTTARGLAYTASPVLHDGKLYVLTDTAQLSCFNGATGEPFYQQVRFDKPYNIKASPVGVKGKLYISTEEGDVVVVRMGEKFEVLATNTLADQSFISTPAVVDGDIFLRSRTHLFRIGEPGALLLPEPDRVMSRDN